MSIAHRHLVQTPFWLTLCFLLDPSAGAQVWTSIGPSPIAGNNGPTGSITSLAIDPANSNHWLLGSAGGGVWSSTNAGAQWSPTTDAQPTLSIGSIAFARGNSQIVYAGTGNANYTGHAQAGQGILKSADGGSTWTLIAAGTFLYTSTGAIRVNPSNSDNVEVVMSRAQSGRDSEPFLGPYPPPFGVQISMDGGATWTMTLAGESTSLEIDPGNFNNQFTAISLPAGYGAYNTPAATGVYRSADGGNTWTVISGLWSGQSVGRILVALSPSNPNTLYASVQGSNQHLLGIYRTDNAQAATPTWIQIPRGGNWSTLGSSYVDYCGFSCTQTDLIAVNPSNADILYAGGASLWQCSSCNANAQWTDIGYKQGQWSIPSGKRCLAWSGSLMIACTDGGAFSTATGSGPWQDHNGSLSVARLVSGALNPTNPNAALAGAFDNAAALWSGSTAWQSLGTGTAEVALATGLPNLDMMTSSGEAIFRTTNGGQSFFQETTGFTSSPTLPGFLPVRKCPAMENVFLTGTSLLQRSNNFFQRVCGILGRKRACRECHHRHRLFPLRFQLQHLRVRYVRRPGGDHLQRRRTWSNLDPNGTLPTRTINSLAFDPDTSQPSSGMGRIGRGDVGKQSGYQLDGGRGWGKDQSHRRWRPDGDPGRFPHR